MEMVYCLDMIPVSCYKFDPLRSVLLSLFAHEIHFRCDHWYRILNSIPASHKVMINAFSLEGQMRKFISVGWDIPELVCSSRSSLRVACPFSQFFFTSFMLLKAIGFSLTTVLRVILSASTRKKSYSMTAEMPPERKGRALIFTGSIGTFKHCNCWWRITRFFRSVSPSVSQKRALKIEPTCA